MYEDKTYENLLSEMLNKVPSDVDKREGSIVFDAIAPCAYFLAQQYFLLSNYLDLVLPDTAVGEYLDRAVSAYGLKRKPATHAVRKVVATALIDIGSRWGINDLIYTITGNVSPGEYTAECSTPGEIGNQYSGTLQPISNVTGVTASITDIITAGTDEETNTALRERFYTRVRLSATSGNAYQYRGWAMEVPGVGDAKVIPLDNGPGTVTVLVVDDDKGIDATLIPTVKAHIEEVRPIGATVSVQGPQTLAVNVAANVLRDGSKGFAEIEMEFDSLLAAYIESLVFKSSKVSYARIGNALLSTEGVSDYSDLKVNGGTANITLAEKQIPVKGNITLTEVNTLAAD